MEDFPIDDDCILSRNFLKDQKAVLSYYSNAIVMAGDVMNPVPFLTAEERAFHLARRDNSNDQYVNNSERQLLYISKTHVHSSDNLSTLDHPPSDCRRESIESSNMPEIDTLKLQLAAQCTQKIRSFEKNESASTLRICSWNFCGLRSNIQKEGFNYLLQGNPDIIAVQETKCPD